MVRMSVNRFCGDCMEHGEFLPLKLVMMNIDSGIWMCPKDECAFPMSSPCLQDYMEENLNSDKVMMLTGNTICGTIDKLQDSSKRFYKKNVDHFKIDTGQSASSKKSDKSKTISELSFNNNIHDAEENTSTHSEKTSIRSYSSMTERVPLPSNKDLKGLPLWENQELLCWLDSIMSLLVLCESLQQQQKENGVLQRFYQQFNDLEKIYRTTGNYQSVKENLEILRSCTLKFLHQKMSDFTEEDSPLLSVQLLLKTSKTLYENMEWEYTTQFNCTKCQFERKDSFRKMILNLPGPHQDLNFNNNLYYTRNCYRCSAPNQKTIYNVQRFPEALFVYCENGVGDRKFWKNLNFTSPDGERYIVTQIVQYLAKRKHFVLWSFAYKEKLWIEVDDLKDPVVRPQYARPKCKLQDVHLIVLEKVSTLENANSRFKLPGSENSTVDGSSLVSSASDVVSDSPTLSGNSSVAVLVSGETSRKTSLCSADGISPSDSIRSLVKPNYSSNDIRGILKDNEGSRQRSLHVPRYSPYQPRSKKLKESKPPSPVINAIPSGTLSVNETESASSTEKDPFSEIFGNEINEFYNDLMSQEQVLDTILSESHSEPLVDNSELNISHANGADALRDDADDESKIHFDIIPTATGNTSTESIIHITDDELENILNGVY